MIERRSDPTPGHAPLAMPLASALVALALFLPRPLNFAPLGAFGLFSGAYAPRRWSWAYPLAALTLYVVAVGGYAWPVMLSVYLGFAGPAVIGWRWLRGRVSVPRVGASSLASSVWFFVVSNLGSWTVFGLHHGQSLVHHYLLGLPYFWNTAGGDLFFSAALFGGYALATRASRRGERFQVAP